MVEQILLQQLDMITRFMRCLVYTHQPLPLLHLYAHPLYLQVKFHIFNALTLIGTIRAIIYGKCRVKYENGELKTTIAGITLNSNVALHICGSGMIGCTDKTCGNEVLKTPDSEFCIYDDLGIMTNVPNVLDYFSC